MQTRGSVLGKRSHQGTAEASDAPTSCDTQSILTLPTPDSTPNPKRVKTSSTILDGDGNKENIPPFVAELINPSPSTARRTRSLRRTSTLGAPSPSRGSNTPRRYASISDLRQLATPAVDIGTLALATPPPSPPSVLQPLHVRARALLRPTCNDGPAIAGRVPERELIEGFLRAFLNADMALDDITSALYISGSPGTGKTALVNAILAGMNKEIEACGANILTINCMALDGVDAVWQRLAEMLGTPSGSKGSPKKSKDSVRQIVERALEEREEKCIVVLDELDHIASSSQALSSLFSLANTSSSHFRLIGIANTHTLTSTSSTTFSFQSLAGVKTLHFAPYEPQQLMAILTARLEPLSQGEDTNGAERVKKFLPVPSLMLLTKKIAAQTGDVRAVFEVLRGAIDIAVISSSSNDLNAPPPCVTPTHILDALKAYTPAGRATRTISTAAAPSMAGPTLTRKASDSETVTKVRGLGLHARLALLSIMLAMKCLESGIPLSASTPSSSQKSSPKRSPSAATVLKTSVVDLSQVHAFYTALLTQGSNGVFTPVSRSEFGDLAGILEVVGLVTLSSNSLPGTPTKKTGKKGLGRTSSFGGLGSSSQDVHFVDGVRMDEVTRGLGCTDTGATDAADAREEEVRAIYRREQMRIAREVKSRTPASSGDKEGLGFTDAMED